MLGLLNVKGFRRVDHADHWGERIAHETVAAVRGDGEKHGQGARERDQEAAPCGFHECVALTGLHDELAAVR